MNQKQPPVPRRLRSRKYSGVLLGHNAIPASDSEARWKRVHEKKRLAAYLKGDTHFAHGREPVAPMGFQPIMWPTVEKNG